MNVRGKSSVSTPKTPSEWTKMSGQQVRFPALCTRVCVCVCDRNRACSCMHLGKRQWALGLVFSGLTEHIPLRFIPFHRIGTSPLHIGKAAV